MKSYVILLLFVLSGWLQAKTRNALIVAVGDYPEESGWEKIHAANDCRLIVPMLKENGYLEANITVLLDEKATKAQIVKELQHLASKTESGDHVYIHFSCHGQQMIDDDGDEDDGLDEAFIPYDAQFRYRPGRYEGENHLRDDELEQLIDDIRLSAGESGNVIVVLDACHSGTGTRAPDENEYIRGTSYIFAPPNHEAVTPGTENLRSAPYCGAGLSPLTVFSACQPDEVNYEYKTGNPETYYGRLTYFFCRLVMEHPVSMTNHSFYMLLKDNMGKSFDKRNRKQTPFFESTHHENTFIL